MTVLFTISEPLGYPHFRTAFLLHPLENLLHRAGVSYKHLFPPTYPTFTAELKHTSYKVFHYIGHGLPRGLVFEDNHWDKKVVTPKELAQSVKDRAGQIQLAFLASCYGRVSADAFIKHGIPHVVYTKKDCKITEDAMSLFALEFYNTLLAGFSPRRAYESAVGRLLVHPDSDIRREGDKVLYRENPSSHYFSLSQKACSLQIFDDHPFVDRTSTVKVIYQNLKNPSVRWITLNGAPGIGKTRVVKFTAERCRLRGEFPHGVHFLSLAQVSRLDDLIQRLMEAAGYSPVKGHSQVDLVGALWKHLKGDRLVVLDHLDQLVASAKNPAKIRSFFQDLARRPGLTVLATHHSPLKVTGEVSIYLDRLDRKHSEELFQYHLARTRHFFSEDQLQDMENHKGDIIHGIDGHPGKILQIMEILKGSAQSAHWSIPTILADLNREYGAELAGLILDDLQQHSPRTLLWGALLADFPDGWPLEFIQNHLTADHLDGFNHLVQLIERSLIWQNRNFLYLSAGFREAFQKISTSQEDFAPMEREVWSRYAVYLEELDQTAARTLSQARPHIYPHVSNWEAGLRYWKREMEKSGYSEDSQEHYLRHLASLVEYFVRSERGSQFERELVKAQDKSIYSRLTSAGKGEILLLLAYLRKFQDRLYLRDGAYDLYLQAVERFAEENRPLAEGHCLMGLADLELWWIRKDGDFRRNRLKQLHDERIPYGKALQELDDHIRSHRGYPPSIRRRYDEAHKKLTAAPSLPAHYQKDEQRYHYQTARLDSFAGDHERARKKLEECRRDYQKQGDYHELSVVLLHLANNEMERNDHSRAHRYFLDAFHLAREHDIYWTLSLVLKCLAEVLREQEKHESALAARLLRHRYQEKYDLARPDDLAAIIADFHRHCPEKEVDDLLSMSVDELVDWVG